MLLCVLEGERPKFKFSEGSLFRTVLGTTVLTGNERMVAKGEIGRPENVITMS